MKKLEGIILSWDNDAGYGFIHSQGQKDIFFHITQYRHRSFKRPKIGDKVEFFLSADRNGRYRAINVCEKTTNVTVKSTNQTLDEQINTKHKKHSQLSIVKDNKKTKNQSAIKHQNKNKTKRHQDINNDKSTQFGLFEFIIIVIAILILFLIFF